MALYTWSMRFLAFCVSLVFLIASSCFTKFFFFDGLYCQVFRLISFGILLILCWYYNTDAFFWNYFQVQLISVCLQVLVQWKGISGCIFLENPKTDLWSLIIRILHYPKNRRSEKGSFTTTTACSRTPRGKKKQQTDPHSEDKKKKQHKLGTNIRIVYILVWTTNIFRIEYTP